MISLHILLHVPMAVPETVPLGPQSESIERPLELCSLVFPQVLPPKVRSYHQMWIERRLKVPQRWVAQDCEYRLNLRANVPVLFLDHLCVNESLPSEEAITGGSSSLVRSGLWCLSSSTHAYVYCGKMKTARPYVFAANDEPQPTEVAIANRQLHTFTFTNKTHCSKARSKAP